MKASYNFEKKNILRFNETLSGATNSFMGYCFSMFSA